MPTVKLQQTRTMPANISNTHRFYHHAGLYLATCIISCKLSQSCSTNWRQETSTFSFWDRRGHSRYVLQQSRIVFALCIISSLNLCTLPGLYGICRALMRLTDFLSYERESSFTYSYDIWYKYYVLFIFVHRNLKRVARAINFIHIQKI